MDKRNVDNRVNGLTSGLDMLQWDSEPEQALRSCVAEVVSIAGAAPPELRSYLVDRLEPLLAAYGLDAGRLVHAQDAPLHTTTAAAATAATPTSRAALPH